MLTGGTLNLTSVRLRDAPLKFFPRTTPSLKSLFIRNIADTPRLTTVLPSNSFLEHLVIGGMFLNDLTSISLPSLKTLHIYAAEDDGMVRTTLLKAIIAPELNSLLVDNILLEDFACCLTARTFQ